MFFREKKSPTAKNPILQLVENQRIDDKIRQRVLISLGTHFDLPKKFRAETARVIEQRLLGQDTLWSNKQCNEYAERIIKKMQTDGKWHTKREQITKGKAKDNEAFSTAEVFVDQVEHSQSRELGPLLIGCKMWDILGFDKVLKNAGFNDPQIKTAQISILNRLISGDSEHSIPGWIKTTAVEDLIDKKAEEYSFHRFYSITDRLLKRKELIETQLYDNAKSHFGHDSSIFLYDLTNTYFEGLQQSNSKAKHNKNQKEKRSDCPQVVVALILDHEGFLRKHFVFDGKLTDGKSLTKILAYLENEFSKNALPTIIMDRGIASDDNKKLLNSKGLNYIITSRREDEIRLADGFNKANFTTVKSDKNNQVEVSIHNEGDEVKLLCKSTGRKKKEEAMRNNREKRLEEDICKLNNTIMQGRLNNPKDVNRSIGRLKERHSSVGKYYHIEFKPYHFSFHIKRKSKVSKRLLNSLVSRKDKADKYEWSHKKIERELEKLQKKYPEDYSKITINLSAPSLKWCLKEEIRDKLEKTDGNYIIKTNRKDLKNEEIWKMYMMLTRVEKAFRNFKTDLGLRPNYHQLEQRVDGHIFVTVLAYHLLHAAEYILRSKNCSLSWRSVKRIISSHCYTTITLPTTSGAVIHLRKPGKPEELHLDLYKKLEVDYKTLKTRKITA
ncbi:MAG: transposase [Bacteroidales bacterium]